MSSNSNGLLQIVNEFHFKWTFINNEWIPRQMDFYKKLMNSTSNGLL